MVQAICVFELLNILCMSVLSSVMLEYVVDVTSSGSHSDICGGIVGRTILSNFRVPPHVYTTFACVNNVMSMEQNVE
jgi:hypothetical protein